MSLPSLLADHVLCSAVPSSAGKVCRGAVSYQQPGHTSQITMPQPAQQHLSTQSLPEAGWLVTTLSDAHSVLLNNSDQPGQGHKCWTST